MVARGAKRMCLSWFILAPQHPPKTCFYLVCGGEQIPERERHDREQMNMIYKIIVDKGLAKKDSIYLISGRGRVQGHYKISSASNEAFRMYGPESVAPSQKDNGNNTI